MDGGFQRLGLAHGALLDFGLALFPFGHQLMDGAAPAFAEAINGGIAHRFHGEMDQPSVEREGMIARNAAGDDQLIATVLCGQICSGLPTPSLLQLVERVHTAWGADPIMDKGLDGTDDAFAFNAACDFIQPVENDDYSVLVQFMANQLVELGRRDGLSLLGMVFVVDGSFPQPRVESQIIDQR